MRVKEETPEELAGMITACEKFISYTSSKPIDVNWPAYAGKKKQPSWYILAAKLLADNGIKVLIHGGGEHTEGRQYASAACEAIGINTASSLTSAEEMIANDNIAYIAMKDINPTLSHLIDMKAELGLRSPVNTLVRHINPLKAKLTLQGMFHPAYMPIHNETSVNLRQNNNIVLKGDGGEFEVRPDSDTKLSINCDFQSVTEFISPILTKRSIRPETVSIEPLVALWNRECSNPYGETAVIQTSALVFAQWKRISIEESVQIATNWWNNRITLT
jgi:anthranilate phosphoribosyltransferase